MKQETGSLSLLCSRLLGDVLFILNLLFCGFYPKGSKTINAQTKLVSNEKYWPLSLDELAGVPHLELHAPVPRTKQSINVYKRKLLCQGIHGGGIGILLGIK